MKHIIACTCQECILADVNIDLQYKNNNDKMKYESPRKIRRE